MSDEESRRRDRSFTESPTVLTFARALAALRREGLRVLRFVERDGTDSTDLGTLVAPGTPSDSEIQEIYRAWRDTREPVRLRANLIRQRAQSPAQHMGADLEIEELWKAHGEEHGRGFMEHLEKHHGYFCIAVDTVVDLPAPERRARRTGSIAGSGMLEARELAAAMGFSEIPGVSPIRVTRQHQMGAFGHAGETFSACIVCGSREHDTVCGVPLGHQAHFFLVDREGELWCSHCYLELREDEAASTACPRSRRG